MASSDRCVAHLSLVRPNLLMRPNLLITATPSPGLRSVHDVRSAVQHGHARILWLRLLHAVEAWTAISPYVPTDMIPGRSPLMAKHANPDYVIVQAAADRIMAGALAALITNESRYREDALQQMEALFNPVYWPEWRDLAHHEVTADLRTGQLSQAVALAYDWLYPQLTDSERSFIIEGIDRCGIQRYLQSAKENAWYFTRVNNWQTCIVGGLGVAGMALGGDHPASGRLIELAHERMLSYRSVYGDEGEFNENVSYAAATRLPVIYFSIHRYYTQGTENLLANHPFPNTCLWYLSMTAPPGRIAAFGDINVDTPPGADYFAAVAAATRDPLIQWYYLTYGQKDPSRVNPFELLWYDETVVTQPPDDRLPKGRAFPGHSGCISSRTDWHADKSATVVFGKAGHGSEGHGHHDAGQICIDGYGERLIVDLGSPPMYPADFFGENRYQYYNAGVAGHNIFMFNEQEMATGEARRAEILSADFDDQGGTWLIDLTDCYDGVLAIRRKVAHHTSGIIAVLDTARLIEPQPISLRWHTIDKAAPDAMGNFKVLSNGVHMSARVVCIQGEEFAIERREHAYLPPFSKGRLGDTFEDRHESYIEASLTSQTCTLLSLFAVFPPTQSPVPWQPTGTGWTMDMSQTSYTVGVTPDDVTISEKRGL